MAKKSQPPSKIKGGSVAWTDEEIARMAEVTEEDKTAAVAFWQANAKGKAKGLLQAKVKGKAK